MDKQTLDVEEFLDRVQNDKELFLELLDIFVGDFQIKRQDLQEAFKNKDAQTVENVAHFLKGSCGNISAKSLRAIFIELEEKGKRNDLDGLEGALKDIDEKFEELMANISELRTTF